MLLKKFLPVTCLVVTKAISLQVRVYEYQHIAGKHRGQNNVK